MTRTLIIHFGIACLLLPAMLANEPPPASAKVMRYAMSVIKRYDTNGDGILQREEWQKMPGTPQAMDLDGDQQITLDELIFSFRLYGDGRTIHRTIVRDTSEPYRFDADNLRIFIPAFPRTVAPQITVTETRDSSENSIEEMMEANQQPIDDDVYQRLLEERRIPTARPYHVLPERLQGVPAWFVMLDRDGDGQVSLQEFAPTLSPARVELFKQLDKNGNGLIEPDEVR